MPSANVTVDMTEVDRFLTKLAPEEMRRIIMLGLGAGADVFLQAVRSQTPIRARKGGAHGTLTILDGVPFNYGEIGDLKYSARAVPIHSNPTTGYIIGPMGKLGFTRDWVTSGTKPHTIPIPIYHNRRKLVIHHPGSRANPYVERALSSVESRAFTVAMQTVLDEVEKLT